MMCDIIIPVFNRLELTRNCLDSIVRCTKSPYSLTLIDNASDADTGKYLEDFKASHENTLIERNPHNMGWVKAVNQGIRSSKSRYLCVMNNDTVIKTDGWMSEMISIAESEKDIGLVNPVFEIKRYVTRRPRFLEMDYCRGHCMLIKREVIDKIGLFDEEYGMGYVDDADLSVRAIRAGYRCVMANDVLVEHVRNATFLALFNTEKIEAIQAKNKLLFESKWGKRQRILFILSGVKDKKKVSDLILRLARKQHNIHIWNTGKRLDIAHTNIREKAALPLFARYRFSAMLYFNRKRNVSKHYDLVFINDGRMMPLSQEDGRIFCMDPEKEAERIAASVDSISRA